MMMTDTDPQDKGLAAADLGDAAGAAPHDAERDALFARLEALTAEEGHFEALGTRHSARSLPAKRPCLGAMPSRQSAAGRICA
jgi:hypothetical protein